MTSGPQSGVRLLYRAPAWQERLTRAGLQEFGDFWDLQLEAVDEGNSGRGQAGWSRVCLHPLWVDGALLGRLVIKRQSNYFSRDWRHPLRGRLTFEKELANLRRYQQAGIATMEAVYCATRQHNGSRQAVLVTAFLDGFISLEEQLRRWRDQPPPRRQRDLLLDAVARLVANLHRQGLEHRCLFPKHIFVEPASDNPQVRLIDLEKTRWVPWRPARRVRDLTALARRWPGLRPRDALRFLCSYSGHARLQAGDKQLWRAVARRIRHKTTTKATLNEL